MKLRLLALLLLPCFTLAQSGPDFLRDSLDTYVARGLKEWRIPGAAVAVVKDGKVIAMKGYGVKALGGQDPVDQNTLFMIGSNSKAFTATSLAMLQEQGKLSLDDKVTKWIPTFKLDNVAAGQQAMIRDLLCHRLGFQTFQGDFTYWTSDLTREQIIEKMAHVKAVHPFRTIWGYTNAAFVTAGQIIPRATGMSWEDFLRKNLFAPLQMTHTVALAAEFPRTANHAEPHTIADDKLMKIPVAMIDNLAPAGSIGSSVEDLSHWVTMLLANGKYKDAQVVPAKALEVTWAPHSILGNGGTLYNKGHFDLYGLGWELSEYSGRKIVAHTGGVNGFVTSVTLVPEENLGIIVLTNTDQNAFYEALKWELMDAFLGNPYRGYSDVYRSFMSRRESADLAQEKSMRDSVALKRATSVPLSAYTGNYSNDLYGNMKVVLENGELRMRFSHHPNMYAKLEPLGGDRFYATFTDPIFSKAVFPFTVKQGKVTGVTVKVADFIEMTPYEFIRK